VGGAAVLAVAGALGGAYYLTIWPQFTKVMQQTAGWDSGWLVAGNVLLALVAHLGPVAVVAVACAFSRSHLVGHARDERREALILLGACALAVTGGILVSQRAPFPRVFAVFLVPATWAAFRLCRQAGFWQAHGMLRVAGAILISAFLWERGADLTTQRQVAVGEHPQNLLQQFYRGDSELSGLVLTLKAKEMDRDMIVVTNGHDFRTFDFYWRIRGLTTEADSPIPGLGIRHVIAVNDASCAATCEQAFGRGLFVSVLAHGEEEAARLVGECGQTGRLEKIVEMGSRGIYTLIPLGRDVVAPPRPSDQS
jgi:hypothetical protein